MASVRKGKSNIGDKIDTQIIQPLINASDRLSRAYFPKFDDPNEFGEGNATGQRPISSAFFRSPN